MYQNFIHFHNERRVCQAVFPRSAVAVRKCNLQVFQKAISLDNHHKIHVKWIISKAVDWKLTYVDFSPQGSKRGSQRSSFSSFSKVPKEPIFKSVNLIVVSRSLHYLGACDLIPFHTVVVEIFIIICFRFFVSFGTSYCWVQVVKDKVTGSNL
jgi:hypothetical protein